MHKIILEVPADSAISSGLKNMGLKEKQALTKLHDVAYYTALKGRPFTDFEDLIDLEKYMEWSFNLVHMKMKQVAETSSTVSQNFSSRITYIKTSEGKFYCDVVWRNHRHKHYRTRSCLSFLQILTPWSQLWHFFNVLDLRIVNMWAVYLKHSRKHLENMIFWLY